MINSDFQVQDPLIFLNSRANLPPKPVVKRKNQSEAYRRRVQKKWDKRWAKIQPVRALADLWKDLAKTCPPFDITVPRTQWNREPLKVEVVPDLPRDIFMPIVLNCGTSEITYSRTKPRTGPTLIFDSLAKIFVLAEDPDDE